MKDGLDVNFGELHPKDAPHRERRHGRDVGRHEGDEEKECGVS